MKISARCVTYARVDLLEELLHSFLLQEDNDGELVIVNDYPLQKLIFDHPQVKIYNLDETFDTIGKKENYCIERCSGDLIATFDDDDIALPWHFNNIKKYWREGANILHWARGIYYNEPEITSIVSIGNSGMVYSKKAWEAIGKSPLENAGGDTTFSRKMHSLGGEGIVYAEPPDNEVSWFYRWRLTDNSGSGVYHQSGMGFEIPGRPNIVQRHSEYIEKLRQKGLIPTGIIKLKPRWRKNYQKLLYDFNKKAPLN